MENSLIKLNADTIYLKELTSKAYEDKYLEWMNNPQISQYISQKQYTKNELLEYIDSFYKKEDAYLFGIYKTDGSYIGNIKLDNIEPDKKIADIGIIIGETAEWGKGYATEAINILCNFAFNNLKLYHVYAGIETTNIGSLKSFLKNEFIQENLYKMSLDGYLVRKNNLKLINDIDIKLLNTILDIFVNNLKIKDVSILSTKENTYQWDDITHLAIIKDLSKFLDINLDIEKNTKFNSIFSLVSFIQKNKSY